jgi:hypothetical protein
MDVFSRVSEGLLPIPFPICFPRDVSFVIFQFCRQESWVPCAIRQDKDGRASSCYREPFTAYAFNQVFADVLECNDWCVKCLLKSFKHLLLSEKEWQVCLSNATKAHRTSARFLRTIIQDCDFAELYRMGPVRSFYRADRAADALEKAIASLQSKRKHNAEYGKVRRDVKSLEIKRALMIRTISRRARRPDFMEPSPAKRQKVERVYIVVE